MDSTPENAVYDIHMENNSSNQISQTLMMSKEELATAGRKSSYSFDDIVLMSEGKLFEPNSPRFPTDEMRLVDRITHIDMEDGKFSRGSVIGELDINPEFWFFKCHFLTDPVMPGCLGLDAMWQLAGFYMGWRGALGRSRALGVGNVRFSGEVNPDCEKIRYEIDIRRFSQRPLTTVQADGRLFQDDKLLYVSEKLLLGFLK